MRDRNRTKVLVRSRNGRMVAGVCAGTAEYFGIDVTLVRALAAWAIIPSEGEKASPAENIANTKQDASAGR